MLVPLAELEASAEQHLAGTLPLFRRVLSEIWSGSAAASKICRSLNFIRQTMSERVGFRPIEDRLGLARAVKPCASGAPLRGCGA